MQAFHELAAVAVGIGVITEGLIRLAFPLRAVRASSGFDPDGWGRSEDEQCNQEQTAKRRKWRFACWGSLLMIVLAVVFRP